MTIYKRHIEKEIDKYLTYKKVIIIYGPRQAGKTTFVKKIREMYGGAYFSCEEPDVAQALTNKTSAEMKAFLGNSKLVILDEAQKVPNIGTSLKLLYDNYPDMQIIATGSSSFELANKVNEPLTGRNLELHMYPLTISEISETVGELTTKRIINQLLIFGTYPGIIDEGPNREVFLQKISADYLYKDILSYHGIKKPYLLQQILKALALQVGSQVSYSEIGQKLGVDGQTVSHYVDILEKAFIVFRLHPLTRRQRDEIKFMHKIYFWDNGILNALRSNFSSVENRSNNEVGFLYENFFVSEKMKKRIYENNQNRVYFWRTKSGSEVDFVEEYRNGEEYIAYESKYKKKSARLPLLFMETYKPSKTYLSNVDNIMDIL